LETSEDCNENETEEVEEDVYDFSKKTEENSDLEEKYIHWIMNSSDRTFTRMSSVPNFSTKGRGVAKTFCLQ